MVKATWNGATLAESSETIEVEGNHYFPPDTINKNYFKTSNQTTFCGWKGTANYFDIEVEGQTNSGAAWYYTAPMEKAAHIKDYVAFWRGVEIK